MPTKQYLIKIDKSKFSSSFTNFIIPLRITTSSGTTDFDLATPFFAQLGDFAYQEDWESWNQNAATPLVDDANWSGNSDGLTPNVSDHATSVTQTMMGSLPVRGGSVNYLKFDPDNYLDVTSPPYFPTNVYIRRTINPIIDGVANPMAQGSLDLWAGYERSYNTGGVYPTYQVQLNESGTVRNLIQANGTRLFGGTTDIGGFVANTWYHWRMDWRSSPSKQVRYWCKTSTAAWASDWSVNWTSPYSTWTNGIKELSFVFGGTDSQRWAYYDDIKVWNNPDQTSGALAKKFRVTTQAGIELPVELIRFDSVNNLFQQFLE